MNRSRRAVLKSGVGVLSVGILAGCSDETESDGSASTDDADPESSDPADSESDAGDEDEKTEEESADDSDPEPADEPLELLAEGAVDHIHACSHAKFDERESLEAGDSTADAPTIDETHTIWDVSYQGDHGQVVFDAAAHHRSGPFVFYTANGTAYAVVGTELEREAVDDDTCDLLDRYVVVEPDDGQIELVLTDDSELEFDQPDEADETDSDGTGEDGYETYDVNGTAVPLAPTDDVFEWYEDDDELIVVDARSETAYERVHIRGAVVSPAPDGRETDDPLDDVPTDARIVTYCPCPHTLAGHRAASLIEDGYTEVYALKEGLQEWIDRGHPIEGTDVN
ncbi:rhodanese-like domain-containing protein [Natronolimnohabitans sp. A-GB9]|uniref:rhodanese-like domain-containing protein n=1 Tax=Natronolimnohabitans sp. A-GB9 TaxID=3069757 RepID=UPI0027B61440|nr:rhodanese-like domain-containing protein [Natronolimnohabitans sp. A-GB9]MDQ2048948.1 rhodanese-like domain-containing protein [Natronolimnohabitans sp. A-GB9]